MAMLSYQTPGMSKRPRIPGCVIALLTIEIVINAALLIYAANDPSWSSLLVRFFIGPLTNFAVIAVSLALVPVVRRTSRDSLALYTLLAFVVPTFAIVVDSAVTSMM